jgi:adenylate cyclase
LWGDTYQRSADQLVLLQDEIASAIVDEGIRLRLSGEERRALIRHPTDDPEAYRLYLRARHAVLRNTEEDLLHARELLTEAIARDPRFVAALHNLSATHIATALDGYERPTEAIPHAMRYVNRMLEIDPQYALAHVDAAVIAFFFSWDWLHAEREWALASAAANEALPTQELVAHAMMQWVTQGPDEALRVVRRLRQLDPLTVSYAVREADYLFHAGRLDEAATLYERTLTNAVTVDALLGLAEVRRAQGRFDEALEVRRRAHEAAGDTALMDVFATARGVEGYRLVERRAVELELLTLRTRALDAYVSPLDLARAHAQLGNREQAFEYFEDAFADHAPGLVFLRVDNAWDQIRDDPRFDAAIQRVGLP